MMDNHKMQFRIDGLQYSNWSEKIFQEMNAAKMDAIHVTIAYHENFRETIHNVEQWNRFFEDYPQYICHGKNADDILLAKQNNKTAIFFGAQNPSPIEDDFGLVEVLRDLGMVFMQLTYNNQSLLATGCYEKIDAGITNMGKQIIKEMNRVGMIIDMSHSSEKSTLEAIDYSHKPIVISHANPKGWFNALRNKSDTVLKALCDTQGLLGLSLYPHHLKNKSDCTLEDFCQMIARYVEKLGINHIAIGSDLCQDQPDSVLDWMRVGRWSKEMNYGEGNKNNKGFMPLPRWFEGNSGFANIEQGLRDVSFNDAEINQILGKNWFDFIRANL